MKFQHQPGRPEKGEYIDYFGKYIKLAAEEDDIAEAMERQIADLRTMIASSEPENLKVLHDPYTCLLYTSPSPRDQRGARMPSSA